MTQQEVEALPERAQLAIAGMKAQIKEYKHFKCRYQWMSYCYDLMHATYTRQQRQLARMTKTLEGIATVKPSEGKAFTAQYLRRYAKKTLQGLGLME